MRRSPLSSLSISTLAVSPPLLPPTSPRSLCPSFATHNLGMPPFPSCRVQFHWWFPARNLRRDPRITPGTWYYTKSQSKAKVKASPFFNEKSGILNKKEKKRKRKRKRKTKLNGCPPLRSQSVNRRHVPPALATRPPLVTLPSSDSFLSFSLFLSLSFFLVSRLSRVRAPGVNRHILGNFIIISTEYRGKRCISAAHPVGNRYGILLY
ncbi:hypothetical protein PUN28_017177 [Cardiocondyla obscurior]|uniref:Uncharacterized protein n=1 Tax=Cardiocondyla obscurior TaxID=286306 RepID=A0AAW2EKL5_9HYME